MNDRSQPTGAGSPDDDFGAALARLGDQLEGAVANQIAARRNSTAVARHLLHVADVDVADRSVADIPVASDVTDIEEGPMSDPTSATPTTTPIGATTDDLGARRRGGRRRWIVAGAAGAVLAIGGVAAAAGVFSTDAVEHGMPGGSAIFTGTQPTCTTEDDVVFDCTLAHAPTVEVLDDYTGSAQLIVDETSHINGGCRGVDAEGLHWTCYVGQRAVDEAILSQDLLGQVSLGPSYG